MDDGDYEPSIAPPEVPDVDLSDLVEGGESYDFGDMLDLCVEKGIEPGDMSLDEEDGPIRAQLQTTSTHC